MAFFLQIVFYMPENVYGDLSQIKLFDILKPLLTNKMTGRLSVRGKERGDIFIERGDIIDSRTDHFSGENAFFDIMSWRTGKVTFDPNIMPKEKTIPITTEQLLLNWSSRKQEFEKIREMIPSKQCLFRPSLLRDGKEKTINPDQWNVIITSNGAKTVSEIAKTLEWDEYRVLKTVYQLVQMGLLERVEDRDSKKKKPVGDQFFNILDMELRKVMGPVAPFVIDDKLMEFEESRETFPEERSMSFIEALSEEIPNPIKRNEFLKVTMKLLSF